MIGAGGAGRAGLSHSSLKEARRGAAPDNDHFVGRLEASCAGGVGLVTAALLPAITRNAIIVAGVGRPVASVSN